MSNPASVENTAYRQLLDEIGAFVYTTNPAGYFTYANRLVLELLGPDLTLDDVLGRPFTDFVDIGESAELRETDLRVLRDGETIAREETNLIQATGESRTYWSIKKPLRNANGAITGMLGISFDITEQHALKEELQRQTRTDGLTGVANRRSFFERAEQEFARCRRHGLPLALIAIDIDYFKRVNDVYGHPVGDLVLRDFTDCCQRMLREVDLCARTGGEEFCILLPDSGLDAAYAIAERIRAMTNACRPCAEHPTLAITASFGIAALGDGDTCFDLLLSRADHALYTAKRQGRNRSIALQEGVTDATDKP